MEIGMVLQNTLDVIDEQGWLEPASDVVQRATSEALTGGSARRKLDNFLNGTWLGHPLHPVLTDVPVGAWTLTLVLDGAESVNGRRELATGADFALAVGLAGAVGSAVTGLAQWQYTVGRSRRLGLAHALLNVGATALYGASLVLRVRGARGARGAGKLTALLGYGVVLYSAYLGGDLVFGERLGVNHAAEQELPDQFVPVLAESALPENVLKRVDVEG